MGIPVGELCERISSAEFAHWLAFYDLEPWGYEVENWRAGTIAAATANTAGRKRGGDPFRPSDFMPQRKKSSSGKQSPEEQRRILEGFAVGVKRNG